MGRAAARARADLGFGPEPGLASAAPTALADFDPAQWAPASRPASDPRAARQAAAHAGFRSRERGPDRDPVIAPAGQGAPAPASASGPEAAPRRRRTGRNAQLNLKVRPATIDAFCALADARGWGLGETLEHAVALLEREYGRPG